jgi:outer membrane immunogenic protein
MPGGWLRELGKTMKTTLLAAASLIAVGTALAHAADLPARASSKAPGIVAAIYDWTGFYVGLNAGGGSSHNCWTNTNSLGALTMPGASEGCQNATGGLVGGQIGYRMQSAAWIFGVEGQGDWSRLRGSNTSTFMAGATNQTTVNALGLFTGQVGYTWNNVLWYLKGGAAVANDKYSGITSATGANFDQASETRWGGVVGTGVEVSFAQNWTVGADYSHLFMPDRSVTLITTAAPGALSRIDTMRQDVDIGTVRVNYRWGGPVIAKH